MIIKIFRYIERDVAMRSLKLAAVLLAVSMLGFGCGGGTSGKSAPAPAGGSDAGKTVVQMWVMPNSLEPVRDIEAVLAEFEKENPGIKVKITSVDWGSAWTKITTAATSGDTPDIVQLGSTWVGAISAMGALVDLSDKVSEIGGEAAFLPVAWVSSGLEGGKAVTSIPWFVDCRALYYRADVLKKAGVPAGDLAEWTSFENTLKKIKESDIEIDGIKVVPLGIPGKNDWNVIHNISPWIWGAGGDFLSKDRKTSVINSQAAVDGMMYYVGLVKKGLVPLDALELNTAQVSSNFNNGSYSMYFDGPYEVKTLTMPAEQGGTAGSITSRNFAIAPYPAGPKGRFAFVGGSNLAIFKSAKNKEAAWQVIKFLSGNKSQVNYAKSTGFLPSVKTAFEDPYFSSDPYRKVFKEAVNYGRTYPCVSSWGIIEPILVRRLGILWDHVLVTRDADLKKVIKSDLDAAAKEINQVLSSRK